MYISRVTLKNIRCFEHLELTFDKPGASIVIFGDNGDGKSTVLRAIAMGLCDENSAAALFRELPGEFVRRPLGLREVPDGDHGEIQIDLASKAEEYRIVTRITSLKSFERVKQEGNKGVGLFRIVNGTPKKLTEDAFPWGDIFVSGYGPGTRTQGTQDFQYYLAVDAVYPLFSYTVPLQNPELVIRRIIDTAEMSTKEPSLQAERANQVLSKLKTLLQGILDLRDADDIELTPKGIRVKSHWGNAELGELGDGYRATVTWILDLIAWWFLNTVPPQEALERGEWFDASFEELTGIVLIDEIEQHLHPRWQRTLLGTLHRSFPKVQFIATTHSPLCAVGTTDFADEEINLVVLQPADGKVEQTHTEPPRRKRADQVLTSLLFGMISTRSYDVSTDIGEYARLTGLPSPTNAQKREIGRLHEKLKRTLGSAETDLEEAVRRAVDQALDQVLPDYFREHPPNPDVLDFEVRRQVSELFGRLRKHDKG